MGLQRYKQKRKFKNTPEPEGKQISGKGPLNFVVQKHAASRLHYDFRLEMEGVLKSWAVPKGPSMNTKDKRLAMMVEDHPFDYKDFEGIIPSGNYGAGTVMVWDKGVYSELSTPDRQLSEKKLLAGLKKGEIKFILNGSKLQGGFALIKMKGRESASASRGRDGENSWLLIKEKDEFAKDIDIAKEDKSAATNRTLDEIAENKSKIWKSNRKPASRKLASTKQSNRNVASTSSSRKSDDMPHEIKPMLATLVKDPFDKQGWVFEVKWDGFRAIAEVQNNKAELYSRNLLSFNELFSPIVKSLSSFKTDAVFDGEVVVLDEQGKSQFQLLQNYQTTGSGNLVYYVFDLLYYDGEDLRESPLVKRKQLLKKILPKSKNIKYSEHVDESGVAFFDAAQKQGLEGILAKDAHSPYRTGRRSAEWLKVKTHMRQETVIGGFTEPRGSRKNLGALILGVYDDDGLIYIGHTGGGFNQKSLQNMHSKLEPLITDKSPFNTKFKTNAPVTWVKPKLVCEINFAGWTEDGHMRQPIFVGLRPDKPAKEVKREVAKNIEKIIQEEPTHMNKEEIEIKINRHPVKLSNLDKVFWPKEKYTKGDVVDYYRKISKLILPYLKNRPESLHRHPNGIEGKSFFQKDVEDMPPKWVRTHKIYSESNQKKINYLLCQDEATLIYLANLGCIEINPWSSRIKKLDYPDYLVMDLDPEKIGFDKVIEAAQTVHEILELAKIPSYCKTSGATGLHIYVPLGAKYTYEQSKQFTEILAHIVHGQLPDTTSVERSPKKRQKKIYLDFLQNRRGQTLAAPYSLRPKQGATVSTPLLWKEVKEGLDPGDFNIKTIFKRIQKHGDLFGAVISKGADLKQALKNLEKKL